MTTVRKTVSPKPNTLSVVRLNGEKVHSGTTYQVVCNYAVDLYKDIVDFCKERDMSTDEYTVTVNGIDIRELADL